MCRFEKSRSQFAAFYLCSTMTEIYRITPFAGKLSLRKSKNLTLMTYLVISTFKIMFLQRHLLHFTFKFVDHHFLISAAIFQKKKLFLFIRFVTETLVFKPKHALKYQHEFLRPRSNGQLYSWGKISGRSWSLRWNLGLPNWSEDDVSKDKSWYLI